MSEENVQVVERIQGFLAGEDVVAELREDTQETREALAQLAEPEFECAMVGPEYAIGRLEGHGINGFRKIWLEWVSAFESFRVEVEDTIDAGERILSLVRLSGRTKTGGVEIEQSGAAVWTVREGKLARVEFHLDRDVATRAAGLEP